MIEENRGAHAPRVFRTTPSSFSACNGRGVSGALTTAEAAGQDAVAKALRPASLRRGLRGRNHDHITSGIAEEEALKKGMEEKSKEFVEKGAEVYAKA
jgi:hypothetical protein